MVEESVTFQRERTLPRDHPLRAFVGTTGYSQRRKLPTVPRAELPQCEWTIEFYDVRCYHFVADVVDIDRYRWHHDRGDLMYQRLGRPRPSYYPDLENA